MVHTDVGRRTFRPFKSSIRFLKAVKLLSFRDQVRIVDARFTVDLNSDLSLATIMATSSFEGLSSHGSFRVELDIGLVGEESNIVKSTTALTAGATSTTVCACIENPQLWWPWRLGKPTMYQCCLTIVQDNTGKCVSGGVTTNIGIRRLRLVQEELLDKPGKSFYFEINAVPLFVCGTNWIPPHAFESAITAEDYQDWVRIAAEGNQDMIRGRSHTLRFKFHR